MANVPPGVDGGAEQTAVPPAPSVPPPSRDLGPLRAKLVRRAAWLALSLALYALLGFQLAPWLLRRQAVAYVRAHFGRTLTVGEVRIDPFAASLEVRDLALPDADGMPLLALDRAFVDFEALAALGSLRYVFREISIARPRVRAVMRVDGTLNLADLAARSPVDSKVQPADGALPPVSIEALTVTEGELDFHDRGRARPVLQRFAPVSFALSDFRTTAEGGAFSLEAAAEGDTRFAWKGALSLAPTFESAGTLAVHHAPLKVLADYFGDALPIDLRDGFIELAGSYDVALGAAPRTALTLSHLTLSGLALRGRDPARTPVDVASIAIEDGRADLVARRLSVRRVAVRGLRTRVRREADRTLNLARLTSPMPADGDQGDDAPPWSLTVGRLAVVEAALSVEDHALSPVASFALSPVSLTLDGPSLDLTRPVPLALRATIEQSGTLQVDGTLTPATLAAELSVALEGARLAALKPYVDQAADLTIVGGVLGLRGKVRSTPREGAPRLEVTGDVSVRDLKTIDNTVGQVLASCAELSLRGVAVATEPSSLHIAEVALREPYAHVVLSEAQTLNLATIVRSGRAAPSAPVAATTAPSAQSPDVRIDAVNVSDMQLSFADHHVKPSFAAELRGLKGNLRGLSSDPESRADVVLEGRLGGSAPVSIAGKLQPFAYQKSTDLRMTWKNVALPLFNPYSGRLTGYNILRGELTTDLRYKLRDQKLDAQHKIRVDQLTWGEATALKEAATLPVRLATALLRDRSGVIALDLPVSGKLSDPSFRLGPIVWKAVENIVVKAASAPFSLLGSLFRGAEEARFVHFSAGDAALGDAAKRELAALGEALASRPELTLDVPIGVVDALDRPALEDRKYREAMARLMAKELRGPARAAPFASLEEGDRIDLLEALYEQLTGDEPELPDAPPAPEGTGFRARRALKRAFALRTLERMVRAKLTVDEAELAALGHRRAEAIEQALTADGTLEATRVLLAREGAVARAEHMTRYELALH